MSKSKLTSKLKTKKSSSKPKSNSYITKSGRKVKLHTSLLQRYVSRRDKNELRKAELLRDMPKGRFKRLLFHLQPKRIYHYWFSKRGAVTALKIVGIGLVSGFVVVMGVFAYFRKDLPNLKDISGSSIGGSIRYYDKTGQTLLWEDYDAVKRIPVDGSQISQYMKDATVALEDRDFYKHGGFDMKGIIRAGLSNIFGGSSKQGGSTITQQLVKLNEDWSEQRTYSRKIKELILAVELERTYSKDEILAGYLNTAPYGNIEYGVEAASRDYFQKSAKDLTLDESAFLAAIPKAPSSYSPYGPYYNDGGKEAAVDRAHYALGVMKETGKITQAQYDEAMKTDTLAKVKSQPTKYAGIKAPYFVLAAKEQLENKFEQTYKRGGWKVVTTLDLSLQDLAEKSLNDGMAQMKRQHADNAAFVAEDNQTGQVVALIGGVDFTNPTYGQINYANDVNISPGSSIKPYDYTVYIENNTNVGAGSVLYDQVGPLPGYPCDNRSTTSGNCLNDFDRNQNTGPLTLRYALGASRNIPAAKAVLSVVPGDTSSGKTTSINKWLSTINALMDNPSGYKCYKTGTDVTRATKNDETQCYTAAAIGDGAYLHLTDHVNGIASISRLGKAIPQTFILKVTDSSNKVIDQFTQPTGTQVVRPDAAYIVSDMASDPKASYLGGSCSADTCTGNKFHLYKGWRNGIKTGTTNDQFDGLMMSWNTKYTAGIWVGNHSRTVSYSGQPENMTDPIMRQFMKGAIDQLGNVAPVNWTKPSGVQTAPAYVVRKAVYSGQSVPSSSTDLFPSWYQSKVTGDKKQTIDVISNKLATDCTPDLAKKELDNSSSAAFSVDQFSGADADTNNKDDVHLCTDSRPTISVNTGAGTGNSYSITVIIGQGTHDLVGNSDKGGGKLNIMVDGAVVQSFDLSSGTYSYTASYTPTSADNHTVSAQVIDSVLYEATSSSATISPVGLSYSVSGGFVKFSFTSSNGNVKVYTSSGSNLCSGGSCSTPGVSKLLVPTGTNVYAKDSVDNASPTISVTY